MLTDRDFKIIARGVRLLSLPDTPGLRKRLALIIGAELYGLRGRSVDGSFNINTFMDECLVDEVDPETAS